MTLYLFTIIFGNCNYISIHQMLWSLIEITLKRDHSQGCRL